MKYLSTRDDSLSRSFNDILYQGLSRDGKYRKIRFTKNFK